MYYDEKNEEHSSRRNSERRISPSPGNFYVKLAKDTGIPQTCVSEIVKGNRRITADTALRLSIYFGNSPEFWLGLQDDYDIEEERSLKEKELVKIKRYSDYE